MAHTITLKEWEQEEKVRKWRHSKKPVNVCGDFLLDSYAGLTDVIKGVESEIITSPLANAPKIFLILKNSNNANGSFWVDIS